MALGQRYYNLYSILFFITLSLSDFKCAQMRMCVNVSHALDQFISLVESKKLVALGQRYYNLYSILFFITLSLSDFKCAHMRMCVNVSHALDQFISLVESQKLVALGQRHYNLYSILFFITFSLSDFKCAHMRMCVYVSHALDQFISLVESQKLVALGQRHYNLYSILFFITLSLSDFKCTHMRMCVFVSHAPSCYFFGRATISLWL